MSSPASAPGLYALTARVAGGPAGEDWDATATQWFVVTDLGLATLTGADGLHVFLRGLSDAAARAGVEVKLLARNNDVLGERRRPTPRATPASTPASCAAAAAPRPASSPPRPAQDYAFLNLAEPGFDLSDRGVAGRPAPPPVDVFVTTERGAYRPGETVFATVLARDDRARAVEGLTLTAIVTRADGVEYGRYPAPRPGRRRPQRSPSRSAPAPPPAAGASPIHADPEAPPLATASLPRRGLHPRARRPRPDPARRPGRPRRPADPRRPRRLPLGRARRRPRARGRDPHRAWPATSPAGPASCFGLEDEPFASGYAALAPATTDADGTARHPARPAADRPGQPPAHPHRHPPGPRRLRPPGRAQPDPPAPARRAPLIGLRPLFDGAVDEGGTAGFEAIALGPDLAPTDLAGVELDPLARRHRLPVVRGRRRLELRAGHPPQPRRQRHPRPRGRRARPPRPPRRLGPLRAGPRRHRRPLHRDERRLRRRLGRRRRRLRDPRLPRALASTATPTPPATPPAPASSSRTPASSSSPSWATG